MRRTQLVAALLVCGAIGFPRAGSAQDAARPTILNVTMDAAGDRLTITGSGFGAAPVVTIDGQPAPVLPGATDTQVTVVTPTVLLTSPGTYRLTVVDSVRRVGEVFVVASREGFVPAVNLTRGGTSAAPGGAAIVFGPSRGTSATAATSSVGSGGQVGISTVIESPDSPFLTAIGTGALAVNNPASGFSNSAIGYQALTSNTSGAGNTASGRDALLTNTTGSFNTASGVHVLSSNRLGASNTATGYAALYLNDGGAENTAGGWSALYSNISGIRNTASGGAALYFNTTGSSNTASGYSALLHNSTGNFNAALGEGALLNNSTGEYNTGIGYFALNNAGVSGNNTALGKYAGFNVGTGNYNLLLGANVMGTGTDTNTIRIGLPYDGSAGQNQTFVAGIRGTTVSGGFPVVIDASGKLGTADGLGNFGLGTTTPSAKLDVEGSGIAPSLFTVGNSSAGGGRFQVDPIGGSIGSLVAGDVLLTNGVGNLLFAPNAPGKSVGFVGGLFTNPIAMTVADGGNVGIGTTAPGVKLDVRGTGGVAPLLSVTNTSAGGGSFIVDVSSISLASVVAGDALLTNGAGNLVFTPNAAGKDVKFIGGSFANPVSMVVKDGGNVGIGTTTPSNPLQMGSGAYVSAGGVWTNASSRTLKDRIADLPASRAMEAFARLTPVTFVYKASPGEAHVGFIAEDVPDLVATADRKSLAAMDIVAVLTKVVQEQQQQLNEQARQLRGLMELPARLARLESLLMNAAAAGGK